MKCVADAGETIRKIGKTKWYFGRKKSYGVFISEK